MSWRGRRSRSHARYALTVYSDHGLSLVKLELFHPEPERIAGLLLSLGLEGQLVVHPSTAERGAGLVAHINTPQGPCQR